MRRDVIERGPIARLFGSLANTLLDLGLPRIRAWLRERIGSGADVAHVTTEGGFVHLDGVVLPVGPRGLVSLDRATAAIGGAAKREAGLPEARLHAFKGVIRFGATGEPSFVADVLFRALPHPDEAAWIAGELVIDHVTWTPAPGSATAREMRGSATLVVTSTDWRLDDGVLESERARVRFSGRGALDSSARGGGVSAASLAVDQASVGPFLDAASAIAGRAIAVPPGVPIDAGITGELTFSAESGARAELAIDAEGLEVRIHGSAAADGRDLDAKIDARVRPAVAMRGARLPAKALPRDEDELALELHVTGDAARPEVKGTITSKEIAFRAGRPRFAPPAAVIRDVVADLASEGDQALARATARAGEGTLTLHLDVPVRDPRRARAHAWVKDLDAAWVSNLLAAIGARVSLPRDARATIELSATREQAVGEASIVTPRSRVSIAPLAVRADAGAVALDGTRFTGDVAWEDALVLGLDRLAVRPAPEGTLTLDLAATGTIAAPRLTGTLASPRLSLVIGSRPDAAPIDVLDARAAASLDRDGLRFEELIFRAQDASIASDAWIPFAKGGGAHAAFRFEGGPLFASVAVRVASDRTIALDPSARLSGEVKVGGEASASGDVAIETAAARGTKIAAHILVGRDGGVAGSTVRGHVGIADLVLAGVLDPALLAPSSDAPLWIDAELSGAASAVVVAGFAALETIHVSVPGVAIAPLVITDASALFRLDQKKAVWHELEARFGGGTLASAGVVTRSGGSRALRTKIGVKAIAVETVPEVESAVSGRLSGALRIDRRGAAVTGRGSIVLEDAFFPVLERTRPALARYGLEPPHPRANAPATLAVVLDDRGCALRAIRASVPGCVAEGDLRIGAGASLDGAITVTLDEEYLGTSAALVVSSVLAERLTLPVRIGGTVGAPAIDADLAACFGKLVTDNRVSAFVSDAASEVASMFGSRPPPPRVSAPAAAAPLSAEDEDLARELEDAAPDWRTIRPRLEAHRRRAETPPGVERHEGG